MTERRARSGNGRPESAVVVMVDDEPTTLDVLELLLENEGYRGIVKISEPRAAYGRIAELQPDVVLLNLMMPDVSGLEILTALQADPTLRAIPVLIITGSGDPGVKRQALERGAADFLAKPVDPSELALRLRNTLATRAHRTGKAPERSAAGPSRAPSDEARRARFILESFLERLQGRLDEMDASARRRDLAALADLAHWLKGAAGTVGLHDFTEPADTLGQLAREQRPDEVPKLLERIRRLSDQAQARLSARGTEPC